MFFDKDGNKIETATALATIMGTDEGKAHLATANKTYLEAQLKGVLGEGDGEGIVRVSRLAQNNQQLTTEKKNLEGKVTELESKSKGGNSNEVESVRTAMQAEVDKANARADAAEGKLTDLNHTGKLRGVLEANKVNPAFIPAVEAMIKQKGITEAGGILTVGGKTLESYVGDWAKSDEGKSFVTAPNHTGGGSGGSGGNGGAPEVNPWKKETWNLTKQAETNKADPAKAQRLQGEAGYVPPGQQQ